jgi:hypothetical protein
MTISIPVAEFKTALAGIAGAKPEKVTLPKLAGNLTVRADADGLTVSLVELDRQIDYRVPGSAPQTALAKKLAKQRGVAEIHLEFNTAKKLVRSFAKSDKLQFVFDSCQPSKEAANDQPLPIITVTDGIATFSVPHHPKPDVKACQDFPADYGAPLVLTNIILDGFRHAAPYIREAQKDRTRPQLHYQWLLPADDFKKKPYLAGSNGRTMFLRTLPDKKFPFTRPVPLAENSFLADRVLPGATLAVKFVKDKEGEDDGCRSDLRSGPWRYQAKLLTTNPLNFKQGIPTNKNEFTFSTADARKLEQAITALPCGITGCAPLVTIRVDGGILFVAARREAADNEFINTGIAAPSVYKNFKTQVGQADLRTALKLGLYTLNLDPDMNKGLGFRQLWLRSATDHLVFMPFMPRG